MQDLIQQDIRSLLGLEGLSQDEQEVFLAQIGELIIESAVLRLVETMTDEQEVAFNYFLDTDPDPETLMQHLVTHHKSFPQILEDEAIAFKEEAVSVLGKGALKEVGYGLGDTVSA